MKTILAIVACATLMSGCSDYTPSVYSIYGQGHCYETDKFTRSSSGEIEFDDRYWGHVILGGTYTIVKN